MSDSSQSMCQSEWESNDVRPKPKTTEYVHNNDYQQKMRHQEWLNEEALKDMIRSNEKKEKLQKCLLAKQKHMQQEKE